MTERLLRDGYPVRVPPNNLRSLPDDSATIADFLGTLSGPIVLVGHSYGGAVITNAATGNPDVKALVYVDAFAPDEGETVLPLAGPDSALAVDPTTVFDFVPYPNAPAGDVDLYLKRDTFFTSFANGVDRDTTALLYAGAAAVGAERRLPARRRAGVEDDPVLVRVGHQGQGDPAGTAAVHGGAGRRPDRRGQRRAPVDDQPAGAGHRHHRAGGPPGDLTSDGGGRVTGTCPPPGPA